MEKRLPLILSFSLSLFAPVFPFSVHLPILFVKLLLLCWTVFLFITSLSILQDSVTPTPPGLHFPLPLLPSSLCFLSLLLLSSSAGSFCQGCVCECVYDGFILCIIHVQPESFSTPTAIQVEGRERKRGWKR